MQNMEVNMGFIDELEQGTNSTLTENGAVTNISTLDPVLDYFSRAAAMRDSLDGSVKLFAKAYAADPKLALKALFYLRDVRGGQGERDIFRANFKWLLNNDMDTALRVMPLLPEYGRWDDVVQAFAESPYAIETIKKQLAEDEANMAAGGGVSLLAKWLPSENATSKVTRHLANQLMTLLELKPREYRTRVVALRKHIKLLEQQMSANQWPEVDYEKTPGQALRKHTKAFRRHDEGRFESYLEEAAAGTKKMKTATLYTYEVFEAMDSDPAAANAMWENLPDYTNDANAMVMADVSGSMSGRPMAMSVSLALYFAERNKGAFNGYFMTFSAQPQLVKVPAGKTLQQRFSFIERQEWGMNTNLSAALMAILEAAKKGGASQEEIPSSLYIISDMEFDGAVSASETSLQAAKTAFEAADYKLPHIVFWNVDARGEQSPATKYDGSVTLISGASQSTFKYAVEGKTPLESMLDILNSERYAQV